MNLRKPRQHLSFGVLLVLLLNQFNLLQTWGERKIPVSSRGFHQWLHVMRILWRAIDNSPNLLPVESQWATLTEYNINSRLSQKRIFETECKGRLPRMEFLFRPAVKPAWGASVVCGCLALWPEQKPGPQHPLRAGFPGSLAPLHSWHSCGTAINYAQRVHFQFKCVLIPEEQLMASSYWCEKSLPLQWLWINEIAVAEAGVAINRQLLVTRLSNYVLHPFPLPQNYFAVKLFGKRLPGLNVCFLLKVDRSRASSS